MVTLLLPKDCNFEATQLLLPGGRTLEFLLVPWKWSWKVVGSWKPGRKARLWSFVEIVVRFLFAWEFFGVWVVESSTHLATCSFPSWFYTCVFCVSPFSLAFSMEFVARNVGPKTSCHCYIRVCSYLGKTIAYSRCSFFSSTLGGLHSPTMNEGRFLHWLRGESRWSFYQLQHHTKHQGNDSVSASRFWESFIVILKDGKFSLLKVEFTFIFVSRKYIFLFKPPSSTTKLPYTETPSLPISAVFRLFCQPVTSTVAGRHFLDFLHHPCCVSWLHWGNAAKTCNENRRRQPTSYLGKHWWVP